MYRRTLLVSLTLASALAMAGIAHADCESDLNQLEAAYKVPNLTPEGRAALDKAKTAAVSALKKDDDGACHKAVAEALPKVGLTAK